MDIIKKKQIPIFASNKNDYVARNAGGVARTLDGGMRSPTQNQVHTFVMVVYETDSDNGEQEE